ncbi:metal ABC transporter solute-binding protein, Zn/Mn family [Pseudonocardia hispaniensis]|uniref:Metal ABC transporter solute-binding protein, Zn/Mn family n=1 Tax=Pseudonocardia hispaniensis TaxID=904933 RepID=A0ABW1J5A7_9PSEU
MRRLLTVIVALTAALTLAGCASEASGTAPITDGRPLHITTTTNFITDTVGRIGGDRVTVTGLMGPGVDPHLYRASAGDVQALRQADIIFYGGLNLEGKMGDLLAELGHSRTVRAVTDGIPRDQLLHEPTAGTEADPHVWFDVSLWQHASRTIAETLAAADPGHAADYQRNLDGYLAELTALDTETRNRMAAVPAQRRVLVTSHDAFAYFGRRYDVEVAAIQGISTAAEATTADIERVAELISTRRIPAVFIETSVPRQTIDALLAATARRGHTAVVGGELFTDAAGSPGTPEGTYIGMVRANVDRIADALGAPAAAAGG